METIDIGVITNDPSEWHNYTDTLLEHKAYCDVYRSRSSGAMYYDNAIVWMLKERDIPTYKCYPTIVNYCDKSICTSLGFGYTPIRLKRFTVEVESVDGRLYVKHRRELDEVWEHYGEY